MLLVAKSLWHQPANVSCAASSRQGSHVHPVKEESDLLNHMHKKIKKKQKNLASQIPKGKDVQSQKFFAKSYLGWHMNKAQSVQITYCTKRENTDWKMNVQRIKLFL